MYSRTKSGAMAVAVALLLGLGFWRANSAAVKPATVPLALPPAAAPADILVFVSGAVVHPGLYDLSPSARIVDAIAMAGGMTAAADLGKLPDLAAKVRDGKQVNIPFARSGGSSATRLRVDVNTATVEDLAAIPGMPPGLPQAIVADRQEWGPFHSLSELRTALELDASLASALSPYLSFVIH